MSIEMRQVKGKLNHLQRLLPDGLLADARWLTEQGYSRQLRARYLEGGWLERLHRGVFRRPSSMPVHWQQVVASLQMVLGRGVAIGGRSALELHGYEHYLSPRGPQQIHLYGDEPLPGWLKSLDGPRYVHHNTHRLFPALPTASAIERFITAMSEGTDGLNQPFNHLVWQRLEFDWGVVMSTPERAALEMLDELPGRETFHDADVFMGSLSILHPERVSELLTACRSVKVKRLFLWFAERHEHQWFEQMDLSGVDLGRGKRLLVRGGKLDPRYQITMPTTLDDEAGI